MRQPAGRWWHRGDENWKQWQEPKTCGKRRGETNGVTGQGHGGGTAAKTAQIISSRLNDDVRLTLERDVGRPCFHTFAAPAPDTASCKWPERNIISWNAMLVPRPRPTFAPSTKRLLDGPPTVSLDRGDLHCPSRNPWFPLDDETERDVQARPVKNQVLGGKSGCWVADAPEDPFIPFRINSVSCDGSLIFTVRCFVESLPI